MDGGDLVFTIEHPIFMAAAHPRWMIDEDGRKIWPVNGYSIEGERRTDWFTKGVIKYHRTLATTMNTLIAAGLPHLRGGEQDGASREESGGNGDGDRAEPGAGVLLHDILTSLKTRSQLTLRAGNGVNRC